MKIRYSAIYGILIFSFSFINEVAAQNFCESAYMPLKKDIFFEHTHYDKKGKVTVINRNNISDIVQTPTGYKATVAVEVLDDKEKVLKKSSFSYECDGEVVKLDMISMMDPSINESISNLDVELSGDAFIIPSDLRPGQELPDAQLEIKAFSGGMKIMTIRQTVTDRKVEGTETITTPAGTFECIKMTQNTEFNMLVTKSTKNVLWYAIGVGLVKSETFNRNGKLEGSSLLTTFGG